MALILNIDTAIESASVCLARDGKVLSHSRNEKQKDHAAWLHPAIKEIFEKNNVEFATIDAVAVTEGPGSYTGLRIGMATAKGICYAMNKPLITMNTLLVLANAAREEKADLLCPLIDARRMEVFTAIYTKELRVVMEPTALSLTEKSFDQELAKNTICFFGNGHKKFQQLTKSPNAVFAEITIDTAAMIGLAEEKFSRKEFADLAYAEPLYLKEFYTPGK